MNLLIGDVSVRALTELQTTGGSRFVLPQATPDEVLALPWLIPTFADERGRLRLAVQSFLIEAGAKKIVIDTGMGNDKTGRSVPAWNGRTDDFLERLTAAGFGPDDVDIVVNTHLHVDHVGWNTRLDGDRWVPTFPRARYVTGRAEMAYWRDQTSDAEHRQVFADSVQPVLDAKLFDLVDDGGEIFPGMAAIATPGHTFGHLSLRLTAGGKTLVFGGDVFHHACQLAHPEWSSTPDYDQRQSAATRRKFFGDLAGTDTLFLSAHSPDGLAGTIVRDGNGFRLAEIA